MTADSIGPGVELAGRYRLDDLLSESGGARFWRGTDAVLGRSVAVNTVPSDDPRAEPLIAAARASATVTEAHLLRVLDCDAGNDITWVVNEWGWGTSLDVMLQHGPLPPSRAAWLAREVAESVAAAHAVGVAHGRLTPESVLVTDAGAVKLIGFVVSAAIEGGSADETSLRERRESALDAREADVIDLAAILYAALTARWPGIAPSSVPRAPTDHGGPLRPRQVRAGVPRMLDAICSRVLRKEAHGHAAPIETAQEILAALTDQVGDPLAGAPADAESMHTEPTVSIRREQLPEHLNADDLEATQVALRFSSAAVETESAPLPPFEEHPERPLFADTPRRVTPAAAAAADRAAWSPGAPPPGTSADRPVTDGRHPVRTMLIAVGVVLLLVALVVAFQIGRGPDAEKSAAHAPDQSASTAPASTELRAVSVRDFDPEGRNARGKPDPRENPGEVSRAVDDNPDTGWTTLTYASADLGGLKSGVGLLLDLGADKPVKVIRLAIKGTPTSIEAYVAPPGDDAPPTSLSGLSKAGGITADQREATLRLDSPVTTRFVVVWLTQLPAYRKGFRGEIDRVTVLS